MTKHAGRDHPDFDWRERAHYEYTNRISDRGWAWEGLRRNPGFQQAWREARPGIDCEDLGNGVTVVKVRESAKGLGDWSILYSDSPHIDARNAAIVWQSPRMQVLKTVALPEGSRRGWGFLRLRDVRCSTLVVIAPDGRQHILFHGHGGGLQLAVAGASVLESVHLLIDAIPDTADIKSHLQVQTLLGELRTRGQLAFSENVPKLRAERFSLVLQALDGFLADASLREIGVALFGADRVAMDWDDDHRHLKDRVRRAVARGKWLMEGGYEKYLK